MKYHKQLKDQAAEYKVIIQHHRSVNEKILVDKELSQNCCNLAAILCAAESKFEEEVKELYEQWCHKMKNAKELWTVGEKSRQEDWQEKKIKELKETAIREAQARTCKGRGTTRRAYAKSISCPEPGA